MSEIDNKMVFFGGALLTSLIGFILMLATEFAGFYNYFPRIWGSIFASFDYTTGIIIIFMAIILFLCFIISFVALRYPDKIPSPHVIRSGFFGSITVFILTIIGIIIFEVEMADYNYTNWWWGAGFYGSLIGSLLTAIFFYLAMNSMEISIIPA